MNLSLIALVANSIAFGTCAVRHELGWCLLFAVATVFYFSVVQKDINKC